MPNHDIELRSDEVQEILSRVPHWMIRWGNLIMLILLLILIGMSCVIKYPEVIKADITITTATPPERLIAKTSGRLEKILIRNKQRVNAGTPIAIVENTADYADVFKLKYILDTLTITDNDLNFPLTAMKSLNIGDVGNQYAAFEKDYIAYKLYSDLKPHEVEKSSYKREILFLQQRLQLTMEQKSIGEEELKVKKRELERYNKLHQKGVISSQEWDSKNLEYLQFSKELKNLPASIAQIKSAINDLAKSSKNVELSETKDNVNLYKNMVQSLSQLKEEVSKWEMKFVLRASITGEVTFLQYWKENQTITEGENVFSIIPVHEGHYLGKVKAQAQNSGKIKIGQKVNIRLANYPTYEFGILRGKIQYISLTPDEDGQFMIDVVLPENLKTSYNEKIAFQQEMRGTADIITKDLRLIDHLLYQFRDLIS